LHLFQKVSFSFPHSSSLHLHLNAICNRINYTLHTHPNLGHPFGPIDTIAFFITLQVASTMHLLHLGPALVLGLLSLRLTIALPTQDQHTPGSTASGVSASTSSVSESANTDESVVLAGIPKLTPDNTCGNAGSGKNKGYACDPKRVGGGGCCSEYVGSLVVQMISIVADIVLLQGNCGL
jgi:hypothetical protein